MAAIFFFFFLKSGIVIFQAIFMRYVQKESITKTEMNNAVMLIYFNLVPFGIQQLIQRFFHWSKYLKLHS